MKPAHVRYEEWCKFLGALATPFQCFATSCTIEYTWKIPRVVYNFKIHFLLPKKFAGGKIPLNFTTQTFQNTLRRNQLLNQLFAVESRILNFCNFVLGVVES